MKPAFYALPRLGLAATPAPIEPDHRENPT